MATLALFGGEKTVTLDYEKEGNLPLVNEKGIQKVTELMRKGEISFSPIVKEFERKFADYVGAKYALCCCNGTTSLQEALFAVGVKPGDEVIVPSYTFWATAAPIVAAHGVPVFCDVDKDTYCLDPIEIEKKITNKTRAIMVVHVWGNPADMDSIVKVARKYKVAVVEDCSHAHGAEWKGEKVGILGDVGCFSLQGSKLLPGGEAGILVTNNRECYERAVALGHYERLTSLPEDSLYKKYALTGLGFKHRVHPLAIAIADSAFEDLDERSNIRNRQGKLLEDGIKAIKCITVQKVYDGAVRQFAYHFATYDETSLEGVSAMTFMKALKAEGVIVGVCGYGRLHKAPLFVEGEPYGNGCPGNCTHVSNNFDRTNVVLPVTEYLASHTFMAAPRFEKENTQLIEQYVSAYNKVVSNVDELIKYERDNGDINNDERLNSRSINLL
jgi:perosamine synthetase